MISILVARFVINELLTKKIYKIAIILSIENYYLKFQHMDT